MKKYFWKKYFTHKYEKKLFDQAETFPHCSTKLL